MIRGTSFVSENSAAPHGMQEAAFLSARGGEFDLAARRPVHRPARLLQPADGSGHHQGRRSEGQAVAVPRRAAHGQRELDPEARGDSRAFRAGEGSGESIVMKALVELLVKSLVDHPEEVEVIETVEEGATYSYEVHVAPEDHGKVIGKQGKIANAIRTVVKAAAVRADARAFVEIIS